MAEKIKEKMAQLRQEADLAIERAEAAERKAKEVRTRTFGRAHPIRPTLGYKATFIFRGLIRCMVSPCADRVPQQHA